MEVEMSKAEYNITLDRENGIVRVVARGEIVKAMGEEIITKARTTAAEHQYHIFYDVRDTKTLVSFADWFFLPRTLDVFKKSKVRMIKAAVLISPGDHEKAYKFYETVTHNLGMNLRIFLEENEAVAWLRGGK